MNELHLGLKEGQLYSIPFDSGHLHAHSIVLGQSGSGKSFLLARLIEELRYHSAQRIVILDVGDDYSYLEEVDSSVWENNPATKENIKISSSECDDQNKFTNTWKDLVKSFSFFEAISLYEKRRKRRKISKSYPLYISINSLSEEAFQQLLLLDPTVDPGAVWLANELFRRSQAGWGLDTWRDICKKLGPWSRGRIAKVDESTYGNLPRIIAVRVTSDTVLRVANALREIVEYDIWTPEACTSELKNCLTRDDLGLICINLASIERQRAKLAVANFVMECIWVDSRERRWKASGGSNHRRPTFVLIDEAHNLAPKEPEGFAEKGTLEVLCRIAAEGRKEGIFLILGTQRPQKLHEDVASECDNLCLMKLEGNADLDWVMDKYSFVEKEIRDKLKSFDPGNAILAGKWEKNPSQFKVLPRRTLRSGGNIKDNAMVI